MGRLQNRCNHCFRGAHLGIATVSIVLAMFEQLSNSLLVILMPIVFSSISYLKADPIYETLFRHSWRITYITSIKARATCLTVSASFLMLAMVGALTPETGLVYRVKGQAKLFRAFSLPEGFPPFNLLRMAQKRKRIQSTHPLVILDREW